MMYLTRMLIKHTVTIQSVGRINLLRSNISVRLTTITDLKNDKWTYIYDMTMDEPICCFGKKKGGES